MELRTWIGLLLALATLLGIARWKLYVALFAAAVVLGLFALSFQQIGLALLEVFRDPGIVLLALIVAIIPLIGGGLEESGQMEELVRNMRIGRRAFLAFAPALVGMLPMPGGALLSAPLVERGGGETDGALKAAVNVWFRHILFLVYPLATALISSAKVAGLEVYRAIPYLFPFFCLSLLLGYCFLLRRVAGRMEYPGDFSLRGLVIPLGIVLAAPLTDLTLESTVSLPVGELGTLTGVGLSLLLVATVGRLSPRKLGRIGMKMRAWRFSLIILGMFFFISVFQRSDAPRLLAGLALPPAALCVVGGFLLGLITGRIEAPASIIIPIFAAGATGVTLPLFAVIFYSIFLGYVLTPIHPCIAVSTEYFHIPLRDFLGKLALPTALALAVAAVLAIFLC
jgi:integral membrane protein (TIGR00529 family)